MENGQKRLLNHLDAEMRFITVSMSDMIAYAIPIVIGAVFDSLFFIPVTGSLVMFFLKKYCRRYPRFYLLRNLYWNIPTKQFNNLVKTTFPPSHKRFWMK